MAIAEHPFVCDGCGKDRRRDTNHWFILWQADLDLNDKRGLVIEPWDTKRAVEGNRKHACGLSCALRLAERYLAFGSFETVSTAVKQ
jgi:hypothetical protein